MNPTEWMTQARCTETDPEVFSPDRGQSNREAKAICAKCEVQPECLEYALKWQVMGIWGGTTHRERMALQKAS